MLENNELSDLVTAIGCGLGKNFEFKGLGERCRRCSGKPRSTRTRRLLRIEVTDQIMTDRVMNELMGKDASARFRFIMERAEEADELDV